MKRIILSLLILLSIHASAQDLFSLPADAEAFYNKAMPVIQPKYRGLVTQTAASIRGREISTDSVRTLVKNSGLAIDLQATDTDALVMLIMMQASKSAQEDLKAIMMEMKKNAAEKKTYRKDKQQSATEDSIKVRKSNTSNGVLPDISQQLQVRMTTIADRRTKLNEAISALMAKIKDAESQIIKNLK
jgi:hypothetical protein